MNKEKTLIRLSSQVDSLKAHINRLKKSNYNIHPLDVDMLRQKTYELYDMIFELEAPKEVSEEIIVEDVKIEEKPIVETRGKEIIEEEPAIIEEPKVINTDIPPIEEIVPEPIVETVSNKEIVPEPVVEEVVQFVVESEPEPVVESEPELIVESKPELVIESKQEPIVEISPVEEKLPEPVAETLPNEDVEPIVEEENLSTKQTTYDLFSGSGDNAIAERFQSNEETSIAEKMQKSQFSNIREAIGINEKFLFINELFNGDMGRYNKILDDINELTTKQGVDTFLFELKIQFQWADDSEAYKRLKELVDRKFG